MVAVVMVMGMGMVVVGDEGDSDDVDDDVNDDTDDAEEATCDMLSEADHPPRTHLRVLMPVLSFLAGVLTYTW